MLVAVMILSALALGISCAALAVVLVERGRIATPSCGTARNDEEKDEKAFRLSDKRMQEGIANLLGYEVGGKSGGDEE